MANKVYKDGLLMQQVIGSLMKQPALLLEERFKLDKSDFPEPVYEAIFVAINYVSRNGASEITQTEIYSYIKNYPIYSHVIEANNGYKFIEDCEEKANVAAFELYHTQLKKLSLLNRLEEANFDTSQIIDKDAIGEAGVRLRERYDSFSLEDIINYFDVPLIELRGAYVIKTDSSGCQAAEGLAELVEQYKETPEMGMPFNSKKLTTIFRGRRKKKLYIKTSPSGGGKTRLSTGDACCVSIPKFYDTKEKKWLDTGCDEPTLFITTELEISEIQTLVAAYVSGVPEEKILDGKCSKDEEKRLATAIEAIKNSPLYIEHVPNFNIDDIENTIKKYKARHNVNYVFFDYIHTSLKILSAIASQTRGVNIREDNVLMMFSDRMKTLANALNIHVDTSTQANGDWKNAKDADNSLIQGSKAIANKADCGCVVLPLQEKDKEFLKTVLRHGFQQEPNLIYNIYKNRRGSLNNIKLWVFFDYSTCRTTDIFVTTKDNVMLSVRDTDIDVVVEEITREEEMEEFANTL